MWTPLPSSKTGRSPQIFCHVCCRQTAGWIKMALGTQVGLSPGDFVLDGDPAPPQKGGRDPPQFSAHFDCGQTAVCIKMSLGVEVGGDCVTWGPTLPKKGAEPPKFSAHVYYSYCYSVSLEHCIVVIVCSSSSSSTVCILFLEKV